MTQNDNAVEVLSDDKLDKIINELQSYHTDSVQVSQTIHPTHTVERQIVVRTETPPKKHIKDTDLYIAGFLFFLGVMVIGFLIATLLDRPQPKPIIQVSKRRKVKRQIRRNKSKKFR